MPDLHYQFRTLEPTGRYTHESRWEFDTAKEQREFLERHKPDLHGFSVIATDPHCKPYGGPIYQVDLKLVTYLESAITDEQRRTLNHNIERAMHDLGFAPQPKQWARYLRQREEELPMVAEPKLPGF
jgi:hypothetical protein